MFEGKSTITYIKKEICRV